jgi:hypothetical protein
MAYSVSWEPGPGFYARVTDWVTPATAAKLALELTGDARYYSLRYAIIDLTAAPGHTFRRDDRDAIGNAMVQSIGAGMSNLDLLEVAVATDPRMLNFLETYAALTTRPFRIFPTLADARTWLSNHLSAR